MWVIFSRLIGLFLSGDFVFLEILILKLVINKKATFGIATAAEVEDRSKKRNNNSQNIDSPKPRSSFSCLDEGSEDVAILFLTESPGLNLISDQISCVGLNYLVNKSFRRVSTVSNINIIEVDIIGKSPKLEADSTDRHHFVWGGVVKIFWVGDLSWGPLSIVVRVVNHWSFPFTLIAMKSQFERGSVTL